MEVAIVSGFLSAMPNLAKLLKNTRCMENTLVDELKNLKDELMSMEAFLGDVSSMPPDQLESQVKLRACNVRELSHVIEIHLHSMAHIKSTKGALLPAISKRKINLEMDSYVKQIMMKIKKVSERHGPYPCKSSLESTSTWEAGTRMFAMDTRESNHVGLEGAIAKLTKKLSKGDHVSIVGMGVMGKTTLARAVYNQIKGDFDCTAFVHIGQRADMKRVLMYIFDGLHMEICGHEPDQHQLTNQLQNFLVDKRCLFVIDDIWDKRTWNFLEHVFKGSAGIKIITTTRNLNIAKGVGGTLYTMEPLSLADSKELLRIKAEVKSHDAEFDTLSDKILCKCGGVPIAINMIGSFLAKIQRKDWHMVYDSVGFDEHSDWDFEHIKMMLAYSYYVLPYNIKKCLLYLSLFPEGHWIEKNMLIWRWVAEGLVPDGLFETGETYFNELIDRCMIQWEVSICDLHQIGCRVHILMLRLIRDLSSRENFSTVLGLGLKQESTSQTGLIHRLAIHEGQDQNTSLEVGEVLSFYACAGSRLPSLRRFKRLRVIDLESCDLSVGDCNLEQLSRLKVLKYLGLVGTPIAELPRKIGRLELLEMLDVTATGIRELPPFVGELRKLRCLRAGKGTRMMGPVGKLTCLEELWLHSADKSPDFAAELQKLSKMRVLVIHLDEVDEDMQMKLVVSLHKLKNLQVLQVWSDAEEKVRLGSWEGSVPSPQLRKLLLFRIVLPRPMSCICHSCLPKLSRLLLQVETLETQHLEIIGQMPSLSSLCLHSEGHRLSYTASRDEFQVLEYLNTNIELICGARALPRIQELEVGGIRVGVDVGLRGNMPLLERATYHLDCWGCSPVEVRKAEEALRQGSQGHPNFPVLTIKRWNDDVSSTSFQGQVSTDSMSACLSDQFTTNVEPPPPQIYTGSVLSLLNSPDGAAILSEEAAKLTIDPLLSGGYGHITQAVDLDGSAHTTTGERSHCEAIEPTSLSMILLQKITNSFSEKQLLGQGAYGKVYWGVRDDGQEIAVKLLYDNMQTIDDEQFKREFHNLIMLKHPNIVRLVGYCYETQRQHMDYQGRIVFCKTTHKALCFEYMPEGSLQKHLSDECSGLDWQPRYKIIKGACEGLKYLHEDLENPFYHLDLKPDNILLDENMAAKLADFGLSKLFGEEQTCRLTQNSIAGTIGYMPPEYINEGMVSKKFDIFSLGVVMTKIIAGPSGRIRYAEMQHQEFLDQVEGNWRKRLKRTASSPELLEAQCRQVKICTEIALSCIETDRHKRPASPPPSTPSPPPSPTPSAIATFSDVLVLDHDELDIMWDAKDQFHENFKAQERRRTYESNHLQGFRRCWAIQTNWLDSEGNAPVKFIKAEIVVDPAYLIKL